MVYPLHVVPPLSADAASLRDDGASDTVDVRAAFAAGADAVPLDGFLVHARMTLFATGLQEDREKMEASKVGS